jgi:hypothetical protein
MSSKPECRLVTEVYNWVAKVLKNIHASYQYWLFANRKRSTRVIGQSQGVLRADNIRVPELR